MVCCCWKAEQSVHQTSASECALTSHAQPMTCTYHSYGVCALQKVNSLIAYHGDRWSCSTCMILLLQAWAQWSVRVCCKDCIDGSCQIMNGVCAPLHLSAVLVPIWVYVTVVASSVSTCTGTTQPGGPELSDQQHCPAAVADRLNWAAHTCWKVDLCRCHACAEGYHLLAAGAAPLTAVPAHRARTTSAALLSAGATLKGRSDPYSFWGAASRALPLLAPLASATGASCACQTWSSNRDQLVRKLCLFVLSKSQHQFQWCFLLQTLGGCTV